MGQQRNHTNINGIFFISGKYAEIRHTGIGRKICSQIKVFAGHGIKMHMVELEKRYGGYWNHPEKYTWADFIYFRRNTVIDWRFLAFFRKMKRINPRIVVFMEIPTYPYESERKQSIYTYIVNAIECHCKGMLKHYIDRIILTGGHEIGELWGVPVINIENGIDIDATTQRNPIPHNERINILCEAFFSPWHGYERLIKGLSIYYKTGGTRDIRLLMVGDGDEAERYRDIASKNGLLEKIIFYGALEQENLDAVYDISDIGCCSLGRYKNGIDKISDLKSREYLAKGLPVVCGCIIPDIPMDYKYAIHFPNDSSPIDICEVLTFYDEICKKTGIQKMISDIRRYAREHMDINDSFAKVAREAQFLA